MQRPLSPTTSGRPHPVGLAAAARWALLVTLIPSLAALAPGCGRASDPQAEAPPALKIQKVEDRNLVDVDRPERFRVEHATAHTARAELRVTGTVSPDVSRNVPVVSLASGRVVEVRARVGDAVTKGQVLLLVQSADVSNAYATYQQALADQVLAKKQLERSTELFGHGAIAQKDLEIAQVTADKAAVTVKTATEGLRVLGADPDSPAAIVEIKAPTSGVITDQQVTNASGVQALALPNPFTISDLSRVWIVCDVFENDLATVRLGQTASIRLNAFPDQIFDGRISDIGRILDPTLRTAKVRVEVDNPGTMRLGMFVTATFYGAEQTQSVVPARAILHLHDRDWVFQPAAANQFRRVEVVAGDMLPGGLQVVRSGLAPGQAVIADALEFENAVEGG